MNSTSFAVRTDLPHGKQCDCVICKPDRAELSARLVKAEALLREGRKIMLANRLARTLNKDYLQRTADYLRSGEKEERQRKLRERHGHK